MLPEKSQTRIGGALARARRPDRGHMQALRRRVPFWFVFAVLFAFAALQIVLNPFGFSDLTQRYTQDISNLLITGPYLYPATGRDQISVALVEDETLSRLAMPWPWSYGAEARALDTLLAYRPRAVIVDVLFVDPRDDDTLSELIDEIGRYRHAGVPLYFEGATDAPAGQPPLRKEIAATGVRVLDPTILVNQGIVRQYPTTGRCFGGRVPDTACPSLALSVYRDLYPRQQLSPLNGLMEIVWGTRAPPSAKWTSVRDENGIVHSCSETDSIGWARRIWLAFLDPTAVRSLCAYSNVVPVEALMQGREDSDITNSLKGRIVFYGASLEGAQDKSYTPVNGLIASVFVHAMALDNLITFHGRPQQNVVTLGRGFTLDNNTAQMIAIVPIILILTWMHMTRIRRRRMRPAGERGAMLEYFIDKSIESLWHWLAFALALGIGLALTLASGLSVANWVEVVFVSVELAAMLIVGLPDAIWGYVHHIAGGTPQFEDAGEEHTA